MRVVLGSLVLVALVRTDMMFMSTPFRAKANRLAAVLSAKSINQLVITCLLAVILLTSSCVLVQFKLFHAFFNKIFVLFKELSGIFLYVLTNNC